MVLSGSFSDESRAILKTWWKMHMGRLPNRPSDKVVVRQLRKKVEVLKQKDVFAHFDGKIRKKMAKDARQLRAKRQHPARTRSSEVMARVVPPGWQKNSNWCGGTRTQRQGRAHVSTPKFAFDLYRHSIHRPSWRPFPETMNREPCFVYSQPMHMVMAPSLDFSGLSNRLVRRCQRRGERVFPRRTDKGKTT